MPDSLTAWFLVGPTAAGKSAVAQFLAEREGLGILSADSMLVYRGMDIGTDKPSAEDRHRVRYWGLDLAAPDESFSAGKFLAAARQAFQEAAGGLIVAGGTGLYVKCLLEGLDAAPPVDPALRARLSGLDVTALRDELRRRDPARLANLPDARNPRRLARAIELAEAGAGAARHPPLAGPPVVGLRPDPARWKARIAERVQRMFDAGLLDEIRELRRNFPGLSETARHAIGYAEALAVLEESLSPEEARERTARRTWQLARRQMTWFRHQVRVEWVDHDFSEPVADLAGRVWAAWRKHGPNPVVVPR